MTILVPSFIISKFLIFSCSLFCNLFLATQRDIPSLSMHQPFYLKRVISSPNKLLVGLLQSLPTRSSGIQTNFCLSICNLYKWRYKQLGNLSHVIHWEEYKRANAGFGYDFQLINVEDFNGVGESEPNPYFYQVRLDYLNFSSYLIQ